MDSNISNVEQLFAQEISTKPAWMRVQEGDTSAYSTYLKEVSPTIDKAVSSFAGGDKAYVTQARLMALEAAKTYDPTKGAALNTHVFNQLQPLRRLAAQRGNLTHISESAAQERSVLQRAIRELTADLGEDPTTQQIADRTGFSMKRIDALMNYKPVVPDSVAVSPEGDSIGAVDTERALKLYDTVIYNELDDIDKKIYEWATGYGKGEKLSGIEMAKRLKITPAAVSKRYSNIVQKFGKDREIIRQSLGVA